MREGQTAGPLVMDAVLAAIAIEHGATLCTTDRDFSRFAGSNGRSANRGQRPRPLNGCTYSDTFLSP